MVENILVVDDDRIISQVYARCLSIENYSVDVAYNGADAIAKVKAGSYEMVFLDINLPDMSGVEVLEQVKKIKPELKVVIVTGQIVDGLLICELKAKGAYQFVQKPIDMTKILAMLDELKLNARLRG